MGQLNQRLTADCFGNHDMRWTQRKPLTDTMMTRNFAKSKAHTIAQLGPAMALVLSLALSSPQVLASGQNAVALSITAAPAVAQDDQPSQDQTIVEGLRLAPAALRQAAEKVRPALVTIESFGGATTIEGRIGGIRRQGEGNSTGILISSEGHIVTSTFNFIRRPPVIMVVTHDGKRHVAKMLGRDDTRKICILKIEGPIEFQLPEFAPVDEIQIGQWAVSLGVGFGDKNPAVSIGIISAKNRVSGRAVQTDANISPANYGGPLVDIEGRVIGVCVPLSPRSSAEGAGVEWYDSGIGFAVPLAGNEDVLEKLKSGQDIKPGYLGVQMKPNEGGNPGVVIESVVDDSPAAKAGLQKDDVLLKVDGEEFADLAALQKIIRSKLAGESVTLTIQRGDDSIEQEVTLGEAPQ